jgi:hypothetical protein
MTLTAIPAGLGPLSTAFAGAELARTLATSAADAAELQGVEPLKKDAIRPGPECPREQL